MFLLDLQLAFEEVLADLAYPWADPATEWAAVKGPIGRIA